jgi:hypothetical protein
MILQFIKIVLYCNRVRIHLLKKRLRIPFVKYLVFWVVAQLLSAVRGGRFYKMMNGGPSQDPELNLFLASAMRIKN